MYGFNPAGAASEELHESSSIAEVILILPENRLDLNLYLFI